MDVFNFYIDFVLLLHRRIHSFFSLKNSLSTRTLHRAENSLISSLINIITIQLGGDGMKSGNEIMYIQSFGLGLQKMQ